jgi:nitrate reductase alpha subunit
MSWIEDIISPQTRQWEEFYRNRFQHDRIVRSTHGVNCTGGCSWQIHVKDGIVVWETQQLDYPLLESKLPPYEPRGCQRGISFSWYLYSPLRIKYPLIRGALIDAYRAEKEKTGDALQAWTNLQADSDKRKAYQKARGKGGFRRAHWDEVLEIMAAANIYTAKKYGPDRVIGFSPIPAMSMLSYAAGSRFLQLFGGVNLSFYDWYCDLPNASPEIWGEQTDVCESADWFNSKFIAVMGANLNMTRTPDTHFFAEARHNGTKAVVFAPDFSQVAKYSDQWVPLHAGSDGAFWMAVSHVVLKEFHHEKQTPYFIDYVKRYTDSPYLVELEKRGNHYKPGRLLRANRISKYKNAANGEWKFLNMDAKTGKLVMPKGSMGHRWDDVQGKWNMKNEDAVDDKPYDPVLSFLEKHDETLQVEFTEFGLDNRHMRGVPVRFVNTVEGENVPVTTVYDLTMAQYGVDRGLPGDYPTDYGDKDAAYTPAWQEIFTGVDAKTVIQFAREWAGTANATEGKCMIIHGAHAVRLCRKKRRWSQPLCRPGKTGADGLVEHHGLWQGLAGCGPASAGTAVALYQHLPVPLRRSFLQVQQDARERVDPRPSRRLDLQVSADGLDAVLPAIRPEHAGTVPGRGTKRRHQRRRHQGVCARETENEKAWLCGWRS